MNKLFLLLSLLFLQSCALTTNKGLYSETAPTWVNNLRTGDSTLRVISGNNTLFRVNFKNTSIPDDQVCDYAIKKNIEYIKWIYPTVEQIPMTIELVFFDPIVRDCSITISIPNSIISKLNEVNDLNENNKREAERLNKDRKKLAQAISDVEKVMPMCLKWKE